MVELDEEENVFFYVRRIPRRYVKHGMKGIRVDSRVPRSKAIAEEHDLNFLDVVKIRLEEVEEGTAGCEEDDLEPLKEYRGFVRSVSTLRP